MNKLKSAAKYKKRRILRLTKKSFEAEELPHGLFLTTRQTMQTCNFIANNMSIDIKISKDKVWNFRKEV